MSEQERCQSECWIRAAVEQHEGRLLRYAQQILGNLEQARDVVQDTFLELCRQERETIDDHLAPWLFTVCRNRALEVRRKEHRMKAVADSSQLDRASVEHDGAETAELNDSFGQVQRVMQGLSDNQQEVIRLKFQNGLSYTEISRITELSVSNVGYLIHVALKTIREQMDAGAVRK